MDSEMRLEIQRLRGMSMTVVLKSVDAEIRSLSLMTLAVHGWTGSVYRLETPKVAE